jgi:hypothetical protein
MREHLARWRLPRVARLAGTALASGSALWVLLGYALDVPGMSRPLPSLPATHPYTALCLLLLTAALVPGKDDRASPRWRRESRWWPRCAFCRSGCWCHGPATPSSTR